MKKYKYTRKEISMKLAHLDWLDTDHWVFIKSLLATRQEDNKECPNCGFKGGAHMCGNNRRIKPFRDYVVGFNNNPTPSPLEESKDIEFEEIEELNLTQIFLIDMSLTEIFKNSLFQINERLTRLIRNQNLIIKQLKQK